MNIKFKKILKYSFIGAAVLLIIIFVLRIILIFCQLNPDYPPNDRREEHEKYDNVTLKIPNQLYNLKPNVLGFFIKDYSLFQNYDTTQLIELYSISKGYKQYEAYYAGHIDTNLYYNEVYFSFDNKFYIQELHLHKNFIIENYPLKDELKDSVHNYLKRNFQILKKQYGSNYKLFLKDSKDELPEKIIIQWYYKSSVINIKFPNIYRKNVIKEFENTFNKPEWDVIIKFMTKDSRFPEIVENTKEVSHIYNPKTMGWE